MPDPPSLPERIGRYVVSRRLGVGAMGRVYLAHDPVLDRDVAVKLLRDDLAVPDEQRQTLLDRMRQEARAAARVSHPNIVALHDMGEDPDLGLYLVFEYLDGETLKDRLERGPLGPGAAARLSREVGDALATAHQAGVLHRDIKPENIILTRTGAKIADFGIARLPDSTLTLGGKMLGTPAYSAPEALSDGRFSPRSDQFSMAATLYEALSGRRAFVGDDAMAVASQIATSTPPPIAGSCGVDEHVDAVLGRGLAKTPRHRFDTCEDFGRALSEALDFAPRSRMVTVPDGAHREAARALEGSRTTRVAIGAAAVGALIAVAAFQLTSPLRVTEELPEEQPPTAEPPAPPQSRALPVAWLAEAPSAAPGVPAKLPPRAAPPQATRRAPPDARARRRSADAGPRAPVRDGGARRSREGKP
jgi:eukaryotic-like serine/threonine-protein kinase